MSRITDTAKKIKPTRTAKKAGKNSRGRKVTPGRALVAIIAVALTGLGLNQLRSDKREARRVRRSTSASSAS